MIFINPQNQGNGLGDYRHLVVHDLSTNTTTPLTHGKFTVTNILSWDDEANEMQVFQYFLKCNCNKMNLK